jgi:ammonia channel protein AmtB
MKNWKTSANGILAGLIGTTGPATAYLATINKPWAAAAVGVVTLVSAVARIWIGILQNDALPNTAISSTVISTTTTSTDPPPAKVAGPKQ